MKKNNDFLKRFIPFILIITIAALPCFAGERHVAVGGMPFGVKFLSDGIVVVGFSEVETVGGSVSPAYDAGLRVNDVITHAGGEPVRTSAELISKIEDSDGTIDITFLRDGKEATVALSPALATDGKHKSGMWIRDTTAGIGTVTFIDTGTGAFTGLGHGICDRTTGELLKMERGTVVDVQIAGITKGVAGTPGELKGYFTSGKTGVLLGNTETGVYGVFSDIPAELIPEGDITLGDRTEVTEGEAYIWCTLDDGSPAKYSVIIDNIVPDCEDNRCFTVKVNDDSLIEKTGGIVQGMSGSPIVQNGKLIGAVTHVLVNDPTEGYGIFIDKMVDMLPSIMK